MLRTGHGAVTPLRCAARWGADPGPSPCAASAANTIFADAKPVDPATVKGMARSIAHRGPDDEGYLLRRALGLGFRRLSIIDLAGGHQPMSDADESVWVVFNGEIYNFPELRRELEALGHCSVRDRTPKSSFTATSNGAPTS